jgi:tRNA G18 (ribose-2'-O)-methylase SpoU
MIEPVFQIFECQNPDCRLRVPSDLSHSDLIKCPFCGGCFEPVGEPFVSQKASPPPSTRPTRHVELLLDNLRSTLNVGSIFRTADGAGIAHIHLCGTTPTPDHPKIIKTGLGAEGFVPWTYYRNSMDFLNNLTADLTIFCLEAAPTSTDLFTTLSSIDPGVKILLVVGNEVSGIEPAIFARSRDHISLPMLGSKTSLNVAVAAGIAIYALRFYTSSTHHP